MFCQNVKIIHSVPESLQESGFQLYLDEFKRHNSNLPITDLKLSKLLMLSLDWRFTFAAVDNDRVIGLAGYQLASGSFTGASTPLKLLACLGVRDYRILSRSSIECSRKAQFLELLHDGLVVSENYRRQGIATRLLNTLSLYAKAQHFNQMRLDVVAHNTGAIKLYESIGYQPCQREKNNYWVYRRYLQLSNQ